MSSDKHLKDQTTTILDSQQQQILAETVGAITTSNEGGSTKVSGTSTLFHHDHQQQHVGNSLQNLRGNGRSESPSIASNTPKAQHPSEQIQTEQSATGSMEIAENNPSPPQDWDDAGAAKLDAASNLASLMSVLQNNSQKQQDVQNTSISSDSVRGSLKRPHDQTIDAAPDLRVASISAAPDSSSPPEPEQKRQRLTDSQETLVSHDAPMAGPASKKANNEQWEAMYEQLKV